MHKIVAEVEAAAKANGRSVASVLNGAGVAPSTFYRWKKGHFMPGTRTIGRLQEAIAGMGAAWDVGAARTIDTLGDSAPYSIQCVGGDPRRARLRLDMELPSEVALSIMQQAKEAMHLSPARRSHRLRSLDEEPQG